MRILKSPILDSYSLNEKIKAVGGFFKEASLKVPKLSGVQKSTLEYFANAMLLNRGSHNYNKKLSKISIGDEKKLKEEYDEFKSWLVCAKCKSKKFKRDDEIKPKMICRKCGEEFNFKSEK